jgi:hypothetical protein
MKSSNLPTIAATFAVFFVAVVAASSPTGRSVVASPSSANWKSVKYVVVINRLTVPSAASSLTTTFSRAIEGHLQEVPSVLLLQKDDSTTIDAAKARGFKPVEITSQLVSLDQSTTPSEVRIAAKVNLSFARNGAMRASVDGGATAIGDLKALKQPKELNSLNEAAIDGAVVSVMTQTKNALDAATKN